MKKLMFAAAVAAGLAAFGEGIESANTVGYVDHDIAFGRKEMKGMPFQVTGGGSVNLNDLTAMKGTDVCEHGEFKLWWWNTDTSWGDNQTGNKYATWVEYFYDPNNEDADEDGFVWGETAWAWFEADDEQEETPLLFTGNYAKTFAPGDGFFVQPACANPKLVCSGEIVGSDDTVNAMRKVAYTFGQKQLVSPPFPVAVALDDIVPMKGNDVCEHGEFKLWWWNTDTSWGDQQTGNKYATWVEYFYDPNNEDADEDGFVWGETAWAWFDADDDQEEVPLLFTGDYAKTFAVGEGFYIQPACANPFLAFPNPFYSAQ